MRRRQSPKESATNFFTGTVKKGEDGNLWIVKLTSNGVQRWTKYNSGNNSTSKRTRKRSNSKSKRRSKSKSKRSNSKSKRRSKSKSKRSNSKESTKKFKGVLLANKYTNQNIIGYYISEKLDGYRAIFTKDGFYSRNNKEFVAPKWFIDDILKKLPKNITMLDGELYTKRGDFKGMGVVRKKIPIDSDWKNISFHIFDLPLINEPFEKRYSIMKTLEGIPHITIVKQTEIKSMNDFFKIHEDIIKNNGEGTMLRKPGSYYENKRSNTLLKVKDFLDDEVKIIGHNLGSGKYSNVLGALTVQWLKKSMGENTFEVGSGFDDNERNNYKKEFPIGSIITIKYFEIDKKSKSQDFQFF